MLWFKNACSVSTACLAGLLCGCPSERALPPTVSVNETTIDLIRASLEEGASGGGGVAAVVADPTGWGTLSGTFKISGTPPTNPVLPVTKDVAVCAPGGKQVLDQAVVVGPGNGLKNVLIYISSSIPSDNPAWIHESYAAVRDAEVVFDQKDCIFLTRVGTMWSTQKLMILNSDPIGHNTNLASKRGAKAQDVLIPANGSAVYEPGAASPAPFPVSCAIHPWMSASMMVCDHPYFAVTGDDGTFSLPNVPAGVELEFRAWHEKTGYIQEVVVDRANKRWSRGRFTRTVPDGGDVMMNVVIESSVFQ